MTRGQAYTVEAVVASVLLVSSLAFALQVTAVTPLSASTSSQHIENQQRSLAEGVLAAADDSGALKEAVLYYNESEDRYHNATQGYYVNDAEIESETEFGQLLVDTFGDRGVAFNVHFVYSGSDGVRHRTRFVYRGAPTDNAVSATRQLTLYDDDQLRQPDGTRNSTLENASNFYAPEIGTAGQGLYNVIGVEVTVWRM